MASKYWYAGKVYSVVDREPEIGDTVVVTKIMPADKYEFATGHWIGKIVDHRKTDNLYELDERVHGQIYLDEDLEECYVLEEVNHD